MLITLAIPLLHLHMGVNDYAPPELVSTQASNLLSEKWSQGTQLKLEVVVTNFDQAQTQTAAENFAKAVLTLPGLSGPIGVETSSNGKVGMLSFTQAGTENDTANWDTVSKVRQKLVPQYFDNWLWLTNEAAFDLIYSILVVEYLAPANLHIKNIYNKLRSDDVLYIKSFIPDRPNRFDSNNAGWECKLPALDALFQPLSEYIASCNDNQQVATNLADWLNEVGADVVYRANLRIPTDGPTEFGKQFLKDFVYAIKNARKARKLLESKGYMSAERFDQLEAQLYEWS